MAIEPRRIHVEPDTEIGRLLDEARRRPLLLEKDGVLYCISEASDEDVRADYDPERTLRALERSAGALKGVDRDELLEDIYAAREQDSRGRPA